MLENLEVSHIDFSRVLDRISPRVGRYGMWTYIHSLEFLIVAYIWTISTYIWSNQNMVEEWGANRPIIYL